MVCIAYLVVTVSFLVGLLLVWFLADTPNGAVVLSGTDVLLCVLWILASVTATLFLLHRMTRGYRSRAEEISSEFANTSRELQNEKRRRMEGKKRADQRHEAQSLLVKTSMGLISKETSLEVVQYLAAKAIELFKVRYAIVGALPPNSRVLRIMGFAKHSSVVERCGVNRPITGHGVFRPLFEGKLETILCNNISAHPTSEGFPEGHPQIDKVIIVPLVNLSLDLIGIFVVGDRLDGKDFTEEDCFLAELLAHCGSVALGRATAEDERRKAEVRFRNATREHTMTMCHAARLAALGEMTAVMAHELNQPLGSIRNYLSGCIDAIRDGSNNRQSLLPYLEKIPDLVDRASAIIKRLRNFSRTDEDALEQISISQVIANAVDLLKPRLERLGVDLQIDIAPELPPIVGDPLRMEQVLLNLMMNACDAMERVDPRELRVTAKAVSSITCREGEGPDCEKGGFIEVSVSDSGHGIPDRLRDKIFDPFFTTKPHGQGQGLGLAITRSIIKACGGHIHFASKPRAGTTFSFGLPLIRDDMNPEGSREGQHDGSAGRSLTSSSIGDEQEQLLK